MAAAASRLPNSAPPKTQRSSGVRSDPRPRPPNERRGGLAIENGRRDRFYVLVPRGEGEFEQEGYYERGYEIEKSAGEGGTRILGKRLPPKGEEITYRGLVLMSIDRAEHEQQELYGVDGDGGQDLADLIEDKMINKGVGVDLLRGLLPRRYANASGEGDTVENRTGLSTYEDI